MDHVGWKGEKGNEFPDFEKTENKTFSERCSGRNFARKKEKIERMERKEKIVIKRNTVKNRRKNQGK